MRDVDAVIHTATLHKPHIETHSHQQFVDTNVTGTLTLLEEAMAAGVGRFVFTSTTSLYGRANVPAPGRPAAWIDEDVVPIPKNIYGATKRAAEDLCELFHVDHGLPCLILRTSRFFPELDDNPELRGSYDDANIKINELLYRRVDLEDVVGAHLLALRSAGSIGFGRYVISATTPFRPDDRAELRIDAATVVRRLFPECDEIYRRLGWRLFPSIERVYVNDRARAELGWSPRHDFPTALERLRMNEDPRSPLAFAIGAKGYHTTAVYPYTQR
jgi:nucleoside-diphosphate-sugar epimerase